MQWQLVFLSMFPILAFAVAERFVDSRKAVYWAIFVATLECLYNSLSQGFIEPFSLTSLAGFAILGYIALQRNQIVLFKFQPVAMGLVWAIAFWSYDATSSDRLLPLLLERYVGVNELIPPYQRGYFSLYAATMSTSLPFLLIFHAVLTAYAAVSLSTWWWFQVRVTGFYLLVVVLFFYERLFQLSY